MQEATYPGNISLLQPRLLNVIQMDEAANTSYSLGTAGCPV